MLPASQRLHGRPATAASVDQARDAWVGSPPAGQDERSQDGIDVEDAMMTRFQLLDIVFCRRQSNTRRLDAKRKKRAASAGRPGGTFLFHFFRHYLSYNSHARYCSYYRTVCRGRQRPPRRHGPRRLAGLRSRAMRYAAVKRWHFITFMLGPISADASSSFRYGDMDDITYAFRCFSLRRAYAAISRFSRRAPEVVTSAFYFIRK